MSIQNLFFVSYWFDQPYIARGGVAWVWLGIFLFLIIAGVTARVVALSWQDSLMKEVLRRTSAWGFTWGLLGLAWFFFRQERIPFLAWRFWLVIGAVAAGLWLYKIIWYAVKRIPQIRSENQRRLASDRFIPKATRR